MIIRKSFLYSLIYVGIGTISVLGLYPSSPLYWDWSYIGVLLTFPVSALSFGIAYGAGTSYTLILLIQLVMFFICWFILYRVMMKRHNRNLKK